MNHVEKVFQCFPAQIRGQIAALDRLTLESIEEIRVYRGKEVQLFAAGRRIPLSGKVNGEEISNLLHQLMKFSYYAYEEDMAKGFITIDGGHRVGICGKAVMEKGRVTLIREVSSLNIRCARAYPGIAEHVMAYVCRPDGQLSNLLIASPPGCGKTTLLRDIARTLSIKGYKVAICDERAEIAGMHDGVSAYEFGPMVDVLDGCPKAEGMIMLIRAMSPQVIITDEIGRREDMDAIKSCSSSGVSVITTIHGSNMEELQRSPVWEAIAERTFAHIIFLSDRPKIGTVREVICP